MAGDSFRVEVVGVRELLRAARQMPPEAQNLLRDRSQELSETLAVQIRTAASADSRQSSLMAPTVRAGRDRVPVIRAGGSKRVGRNRVPAYKVLFGSEFGARYLRQYRPWRNRGSYWFFRTIEANQARIVRQWRQMAEDLVRTWGH